jgi:hypothetical protein
LPATVLEAGVLLTLIFTAGGMELRSSPNCFSF